MTMDRCRDATPNAGRFEAGGRAFEAADAIVADAIVAGCNRLGRPIIAGLCGAQGSGKSTMAARLAARLETTGVTTAVLSIDDFYLTRAERADLGRDVHPLLETRGVPGTHDLNLAHRTIGALVSETDGVVAVPRFDKVRDDRAPLTEWPCFRAPVAVVILEGWCVGAHPIPEDDLAGPINALERDEDVGGRWRRHVNAALMGSYRDLFDRLDLRVLLRAPDFAYVHAWRLEQEAGLARASIASLPPMDATSIARFIAHYERLTRWILLDEPADIVIDIAPDRTPLAWRLGRKMGGLSKSEPE